MRLAVVQLRSTPDLDANLEAARDAIAHAASMGAELVGLPENFAFMRREGEPFPCVQGPDGELVPFLGDQARRHGIWILGGTFPEATGEAAVMAGAGEPGDARVYNTSVVVSPDGDEVARYRKIHLFDVDLGEESGGAYRESRHFAPGEDVVVAKTALGGLGLSVCYDLRFPELYRRMVDDGARMIAVPSAFTPETGKAHWEVLLRARAIETQCFVLAPAQCGQHTPDRRSHGHSMIIDPWGVVRAQAGEEPAVLVADVDPAQVDRVRAAIPALRNRRL
jgi:predicted amidohydrolase